VKIKKGDTVLVISGKDKGRTGKIIKSILKENTVLIEGINLKKKHLRAKKQGEKGQIISRPSPLKISNIKIICPKCGKAARVTYKIIPMESKGLDSKTTGKKTKKHRICKKCNSPI